jgi:hypothetical protein
MEGATVKIRIDSPVRLHDLAQLLGALDEEYPPGPEGPGVFQSRDYVNTPEVHFFEKSVVVEVGKR